MKQQNAHLNHKFLRRVEICVKEQKMIYIKDLMDIKRNIKFGFKSNKIFKDKKKWNNVNH